MVNIALLGLGTVGSGVIKILRENKTIIKKRIGDEIAVKKILVRDLHKKRSVEVQKDIMTDDFDTIVKDDDIQILVEVMGGIEPAYTYISKAVKSGKHIVTANKELMAKYGRSIVKMAGDSGVDVYYEASVAGGIPIIRPLKESLTANKIEEIKGIINGTTNYILTRMTNENMDYNEVLKEAKEKGYAEADPTSDVEGYDARYKLAILANLAFGAEINVEDIFTEGITKITKEDIKYADELNYVIKLLAIAKLDSDGLELRVHPALVGKDHPLAQVNDVFNAIFIKGNALGEIMLYGKGAGQMPTASAVVADIIDVVRNIKANSVNRIMSVYNENTKIKDMEDIVCKYYIRMIVKDKPGVTASVAKAFGDNMVSLQSIIQKNTKDEEAEIVLVTHSIMEKHINDAITALHFIDAVKSVENVIRI